MELILTEHQQQQLNYEDMLKGKNVQHLSQFVDMVDKPQVIIGCKAILVAYLPADIFKLPLNIVYKPLIKSNIHNYLNIPTRLNFVINNKYFNACKELYQIILKNNCHIKLATDDTLHGEFIGLYFMRKYNLESRITGRLITFAQTPSALRYAYGHPKPLSYHINYATAYYFKTFQKRLLYTNLTRIFTMIMHKKKFYHLFPTYLSQYLLLSKVKKATKLKQQTKKCWVLKYLDEYGNTFSTQYHIKALKTDAKKIVVGLQQHPLIVIQRPKRRIHLIQPPRMLNTIDIIQLIKKHMNLSNKTIIEDGLKPAYWKYHIISYPYTDNHLITLSQFNILKTNLGDYYQQLKNIFHQHVPHSLFTAYQPRSRYVYMSKIKAQHNYQTALIPVRLVNKNEYNKLPKLIQLIEKLVIKHVLFMFAKPAKVEKVQIKAISQNHLFQSNNTTIDESNWFNMLNKNIKQHQVNLKNYSSKHEIPGRFAFAHQQVKDTNNINKFIAGDKNIKTLYDKTLERYYHLNSLKRNHILKIQNNDIQLTLNGKAELSLIKLLKVHHSLMTQLILYNDYSTATNHLRRPYINAKAKGIVLIRQTISYLKNVFKAILTQNIQLPETPPAPKKIYLKQKTLPITCPNCKKNYLSYQKYHILKHQKIYERYYCPHCKMSLPVKYGSFPIHASILPFIFQGMFAPATIKIRGKIIKGRLYYKDKHIFIKKIK